MSTGQQGSGAFVPVAASPKTNIFNELSRLAIVYRKSKKKMLQVIVSMHVSNK
jgi:hypothetical protein